MNSCVGVFFYLGWQVLRPATLLRKRLWHRCSPLNFAEFLRIPLLQNASGQLLPFMTYVFLRTFSKLSGKLFPKTPLHAFFSLSEKSPYSEFFWPIFSRIRIEYGEIQSTVRILENTDTKNSKYGHFCRNVWNN